MEWMLFWVLLVNGQVSMGYEPYESKALCEAASERLIEDRKGAGQLSAGCYRIERNRAEQGVRG